MAQKIATVSTVFAACDRLEAASERWNREDVRHEVGGGGYVVIDPLIRAWRALKPLREVAPNTPAELLHQVAASLESHVTGFTSEAEARLAECQTIFDATVSTLSEKLSEHETHLKDKEAALRSAETVKIELTKQLAHVQGVLQNAEAENARLVTEKDSVAGQLARMKNEHKEATVALQNEHRAALQQLTQDRNRENKEHAASLAKQRRELTGLADQAENRLMMLLDRERQEAKSAMAKLSEDLAGMTQRAQLNRETVVALETTVGNLTKHKEKLESQLATYEERLSVAISSLEAQRTQTSTLERQFASYKEENKLSGELGALQNAVAELQIHLKRSSGPKKK